MLAQSHAFLHRKLWCFQLKDVIIYLLISCCLQDSEHKLNFLHCKPCQRNAEHAEEPDIPPVIPTKPPQSARKHTPKTIHSLHSPSIWRNNKFMMEPAKVSLVRTKSEASNDNWDFSFSHKNITEMCCFSAVMILFFFRKATLILYNDENPSKMQKNAYEDGGNVIRILNIDHN